MRDRQSEPETKRGLKVRFYIMSLWLLFILIFLLTVDIPISFAHNAKFVGWGELLDRNVLAIISLFSAFVSWILTRDLKYQWQGVANPSYKITEIRNENYEYLTFLTTYIIPLICIDLSNLRYVIVLVVLLFIIGYIFVRMDLYYGNPTLALMGYRLYRAKIEGVDAPDGVILIAQNRLTSGTSIKWIEVDKFIWVAKEVNK